jgi:hypothetical protein
MRNPQIRTRRVVEASSILHSLFTKDENHTSRVHRVAFRDSDGAIGRRDFATHWIHRYPAKMFHRIPEAILDALPSDSPLTILDPFCGSGTVLLEGMLRGHNTIGIDINPMARLISRVKTTSIPPDTFRRHINGILKRARKKIRVPQAHETLDFWFRPEARKVLEAILASIAKVKDPTCREFYLVTLSSVIRRSSLADPTVSPPVKLSRTRAKYANKKYRVHLNRALRLNGHGVYELFAEAVRRNTERLAELHSLKPTGKARILSGLAEASTTGLKTGSVDLVITSPPYCGAQKYARSLRLEMLLMGLSVEEIAAIDRKTLGNERVGKRQTEVIAATRLESTNRLIERIKRRNPIRAYMLSDYINYLDRFVAELRRVMKRGGNAFVTFGTNRLAGLRVDCAQHFISLARIHGLKHIATLVDTIPSRGLITIRHETAGTINDERIVWLRR